jgi:hypothetical protein
MAPEPSFSLFAPGLCVGVVGLFLMARRPYCDAMVAFHLSRIREVGLKVERLAAEGAIDRQSGFYRYLRHRADHFGRLEPEWIPGPLALVVFLVGMALFPQVASVTRKESRVMESLREQATREAADRYRMDAHLLRTARDALMEAFAYRSLTFWVVLRTIKVVGLVGAPIAGLLDVLASLGASWESRRPAHGQASL